MKTNLKTFPKPTYQTESAVGHNIQIINTQPKEYEAWKEAFIGEIRFLDYAKWYEDNKLLILSAFGLHSTDGLTPNEVLRYFVEKELLGE